MIITSVTSEFIYRFNDAFHMLFNDKKCTFVMLTIPLQTLSSDHVSCNTFRGTVKSSFWLWTTFPLTSFTLTILSIVVLPCRMKTPTNPKSSVPSLANTLSSTFNSTQIISSGFMISRTWKREYRLIGSNV